MRLRADETELLHRLDTFLKANVPAHIDQNSDLWRWGYIERVDVNDPNSLLRQSVEGGRRYEELIQKTGATEPPPAPTQSWMD